MSDLSTSRNLIQVESVQYQAPVSESSLSSIGAATNYCLTKLVPIGTIIQSNLTQSQINSEFGAGYWLLCNGQLCAGTDYQILTGNFTVPNLFRELATVTPWSDYSAPFSNLQPTVNPFAGTNPKFRRVGDSVEVSLVLINSSTSNFDNAPVLVNMPPGLLIDTNKLSAGSYAVPSIPGSAELFQSLANVFLSYQINYLLTIQYYSTSAIQFKYPDPNNLAVPTLPRSAFNFTVPGLWDVNASRLSAHFTVPVQNFNSTDKTYYIRVKR